MAANFREEEKKMQLIRQAQFAYEETLRNQGTKKIFQRNNNSFQFFSCSSQDFAELFT